MANLGSVSRYNDRLPNVGVQSCNAAVANTNLPLPTAINAFIDELECQQHLIASIMNRLLEFKERLIGRTAEGSGGNPPVPQPSTKLGIIDYRLRENADMLQVIRQTVDDLESIA